MEEQSFPFFFSWSKQKDATSFTYSPKDNFSFTIDNKKTVNDLSSISFQASFGLKPDFLIQALKAQLDTSPVTSAKAVYGLKSSATKNLLDLIGLSNGKIFYTVSGAEAIENALKIARETTSRKYIAARSKSYHGATTAAVSVTGDWRNKTHGLLDQYTLRIPEPQDDPDFKISEKLINEFGPEKLAAFCIETISGANGVHSASLDWWKNLNAYAKANDIQIILDEVVCGFCRTGDYFGFQKIGIEPDYIVMAKSITGGVVPFGALWVSSKIAKFYDQNILSCGLTNYAHPLGLAAMDAVIEKIKSSKFQENLTTLIQVFQNSLQKIEKLPQVTAVRQHGMLAAIDLSVELNFEQLLSAGLYTVVRENMIILAPALNYSKDQLSEVMDKLSKIISCTTP